MMPQSPSAESRKPRSRKKYTAAAAGSTEVGHFKTKLSPEDPAESRSRLLLTVVIAFRDGDFSVRLPVNWPETEGRIAETFNQVIAQKERIADTATRQSTSVGKEGRLKQRLALPEAVGGWAEEIDSINTLIDDLARPTTEIARTIGAMAKGDLGQSMELQGDGRELRGDFCVRRSL